jgi:hypothetical protein
MRRNSDPAKAVRTQSRIRREFLKWLGKGNAATPVAPGKSGMDYILEPRGRS